MATKSIGRVPMCCPSPNFTQSMSAIRMLPTTPKRIPMEPKKCPGRDPNRRKKKAERRSISTRKVREIPYLDVPKRRA